MNKGLNKGWLLIGLAALAASGCESTESKSKGLVAVPEMKRPTSRPRDPWVFRSVLDGHARMLTAALADDCWITYDTQNCSLVKAWKGKVFFTGGVYDTKHGPQPRSVGPAYFSATQPVAVDTVPKLMLKDGTALTPRYLGYQVTDNAVAIKYAFGNAEVVESPERTGEGFVRTFRASNLPAGAELKLPVQSPRVLVNRRVGQAESAGGTVTASAAGGKFDFDVVVPLETSGQ